MSFNGSGANEIFEASANGQRLRFTRNVANIVMDADDVEVVDLNALGGTDTITVDDLSGTDVAKLDGDLAGSIGGTAGDGQPDTVIVNGTNGADIIDVFGAGSSASVVGLAAQVNITNSEGANDALVVNALGGDDDVTATTLPAGVIKLTIDGGAGDDDILGSQGADVFLGGDGDDFIFGDNGNDLALMGAGDDVFQWNPGDGNDTLEGQDGTDEMLFFGANVAENIDIVANGGRVLFTRDIANVTMDLDDVENIDFRALGGADDIVVGDLSGTDVTQNGLDLRGPNGGGDGAADTVTVNGTQGDDVFGAAGDAGGVNVFGLQGRGQRLLPRAGERPADAQRAGRRGHRRRHVAGSRRHPAHRERRARQRRAARQRRRRSRQRWRRRRHRLPRRRRRHLHVEPGRRQRHARGPGRHRQDAVQRRQHRRERHRVGERRARAVRP